MVAIWREPGPTRSPSPVKRVLYTERCRDEDGMLYHVVVWRDWPGSPLTSYTLEDGTPVHYEDQCRFALPDGRILSRCGD